MSVMSCRSISSLNCKNFCFIILNIFLALIKEGGKGEGGKGAGTKAFITVKNKQTLVVKI